METVNEGGNVEMIATYGTTQMKHYKSVHYLHVRLSLHTSETCHVMDPLLTYLHLCGIVNPRVYHSSYVL